MIGQELGGRYELLARVGGGGMAIVYKALDQLLNRHVAIKVLRQQFVGDEEFIRRFRREAQSAASLSHPNVVSIYDVGQEDEVHYIVMEYVEGYNLNEIIKEKAPLQVEESMRIASQICDALDHAHHNGIIHRDIKPHNILIGKNGRVKVTDFGIARAVTSSDITQTGSVIGSVHYFSPEHAKGVSQGEKSDLYSLGIVIYQMLTNQLPFLGESPISVALKHLQEQVTDPRLSNPMIPQSVENIILKALRKNPDERYQSAKEMLKDLETALLPERRNEAKLAFSSVGSYDDDEQPTRVMPAIRGAIASEPPTNPRHEAEDDSWDKVRDEQKNKWIKPVVWLVFTAALLYGMWIGVQWFKDYMTVKDLPVPEVVGLTLEAADEKLIAAGFLGAEVLERENHDEHEANVVISQEKNPGMTAKEDTKIGVTVSLGPKMEEIDEYIGRDINDAVRALESLGFEEEQIKQEPIKDDKAVGTILQQTPAPDTEVIVSQAEIVFVVSEGPGTFDMVNLIDETQAAAESRLTQLELEAEIVTEPHYATPKGRVFQQSPHPGDPVSPGETVTLFISDGLPEEAREAVKQIELKPATEGETSTFSIRISDAKGEQRDWGTKETAETITIEVPVVVSPTKDARITVMIDGNNFYNLYTVTYQDADPSGPSVDDTAEPGQSDDNNTDSGNGTDTSDEASGQPSMNESGQGDGDGGITISLP